MELMVERAGGCGALICSSVAFPRMWAKSVDNGSVSPRSSVRSKQICFFVGDPGMEQGHPVACIRVLSGCILLTLPSWIPAAGAADEVYLKNSAIAHPSSVGVVDFDMVRYACGV